MKKPTDFAIHLTNFLTVYLQTERNLSSNTVKSYRDTLVLFARYMRDEKKIKFEKLCLSDLTRNNILNFLDWLEAERECSCASRNYRLAALKSFVKYLQYEDIDRASQWQQILCINAKRTTRKQISHLSKEALKLLLAMPDTAKASGIREVALLSLMYDCGARVSEIIDLTPSAVKITTEPMCIVLKGKGRKTRTVPLLPKQVVILKRYMQINRLSDDGRSHNPLFFNYKNEKLSRSGITYILKKNLEMARQSHPELFPKSFSLHGLRHTKAMHLLDAGWSMVEIRDFLGHVSIKTTDVYTRANTTAKNEAMQRAYIGIVPTDTPETKHNADTLDEILKSIRIYVEQLLLRECVNTYIKAF